MENSAIPHRVVVDVPVRLLGGWLAVAGWLSVAAAGGTPVGCRHAAYREGQDFVLLVAALSAFFVDARCPRLSQLTTPPSHALIGQRHYDSTVFSPS